MANVAPIYAGLGFPGLLMNGSCRVNVHPRAYIRICAPRIQPRMNVLPDYGNYGERPERSSTRAQSLRDLRILRHKDDRREYMRLLNIQI